VVGLPWLTKRKSGIVPGVGEGAARIARTIDRLDRRTRRAPRPVRAPDHAVRQAA